MAEMRKKQATINDVARRAGTSVSTVSRYFNKPDVVGKDIAGRIEQAASQLHYIRNRSAAATRGHRSGTIGMVVPTLENSIFAELIEGLIAQLRQSKQTVLISSNLNDAGNESEAVRAFVEQGVDGIILIGTEHDNAVLHLLESRQLPVLCVWNYADDFAIDTVGIDNYRIGYEAADHILGLGHERIGCIFGLSGTNDRASSRKNGILDRLAKAAQTPPKEWQTESSYDLRSAKTIAHNLLVGDNRPSAVICGNDIIAFATIWAAQSLGLSVPQDISVMGIGDFQGAAEMTPPLSTIRIPAHTVGRLSANRILELVSATEKAPPRHLKVDFEMRIRRSTAPYHKDSS